jgi:hypothetical protein
MAMLTRAATLRLSEKVGHFARNITLPARPHQEMCHPEGNEAFPLLGPVFTSKEGVATSDRRLESPLLGRSVCYNPVG